MGFVGGLGTGGNGNRRVRLWVGGREQDSTGRQLKLERYLEGDVKTQCSRNFLKSMRVTVVKYPSNGGMVLKLTNFCN